jgi:hypothetical protein
MVDRAARPSQARGISRRGSPAYHGSMIRPAALVLAVLVLLACSGRRSYWVPTAEAELDVASASDQCLLALEQSPDAATRRQMRVGRSEMVIGDPQTDPRAADRAFRNCMRGKGYQWSLLTDEEFEQLREQAGQAAAPDSQR